MLEALEEALDTELVAEVETELEAELDDPAEALAALEDEFDDELDALVPSVPAEVLAELPESVEPPPHPLVMIIAAISAGRSQRFCCMMFFRREGNVKTATKESRRKSVWRAAAGPVSIAGSAWRCASPEVSSFSGSDDSGGDILRRPVCLGVLCRAEGSLCNCSRGLEYGTGWEAPCCISHMRLCAGRS